MAQMAAHLVEQVIPWVPTRQWVVSVPIPLRYWMAPSKELTARVHTIIRRTIGQYYVNHAVKQGATRATVQPGSVTFVQRFDGSINLNVHVHVLFLEGVFVDHTAQGLRSRFLHQAPPTDADIATVLQTISRRVIRALRRLGYLEAGTEDVVPTGDDPARDEDPELARTLAASVQQRIACGERAGQQVRRMGSGFGYEGERPTLNGPRCASVNGFSLHANTQIPAHRRDQAGRHHPESRQQGLEEPDASPPSPHWSWARLRKRVFAIDMARCPRCQQGTLRIIAALTEGRVIKKILRHLKLAVDSPSIAPARQAAFVWDCSSP